MTIKIEKALEEMESVLAKMGQEVITMHQQVLHTLPSMNQEAALEILQQDDVINRLEEEVNDLAIRDLALLSPVAGDLRRIIAAIKTASELERLGDYAKNTAAFMLRYTKINDLVFTYAGKMEETFLAMLKDAMQAYANKDVESAFQIPKQDVQIDRCYEELFQCIYGNKDYQQLSEFMKAQGMLRSMERSGDHVKNICEHIIYLVKGQHYDFG